MAPPVQACKNPRGIPRTHSTLRTPFMLQLHSPPQPIPPSLLPSTPQAPPFLLIFLLPIAFLFWYLPTGKHVFNYMDVFLGVRRGFGVRARHGSSVPREPCGGVVGDGGGLSEARIKPYLLLRLPTRLASPRTPPRKRNKKRKTGSNPPTPQPPRLRPEDGAAPQANIISNKS